MMLFKIQIVCFTLICFLCGTKSFAQNDTAVITASGITVPGKMIKLTRDTIKKYNPNKAVIRSAIIPGWGQATNKKIWKVPLVYACLGVTAGIFLHNITQYRDAKNAYILATDGNPANDSLIKQPYYSVKNQPERIRTFRNEVRQNVDYSVLVFLIFWGLNVADAAVDAHLKTFDVSDDLGLQFKAGYSPMARTNGISLILSFK